MHASFVCMVATPACGAVEERGQDWEPLPPHPFPRVELGAGNHFTAAQVFRSGS